MSWTSQPQFPFRRHVPARNAASCGVSDQYLTSSNPVQDYRFACHQTFSFCGLPVTHNYDEARGPAFTGIKFYEYKTSRKLVHWSSTLDTLICPCSFHIATPSWIIKSKSYLILRLIRRRRCWIISYWVQIRRQPESSTGWTEKVCHRHFIQAIGVVFIFIILLCPRPDDVITQTTQEIGSAYNQNTAEIQAIVDFSKKSMSNFLGEAKMVIDALDSLQHIHPLVDGVFPTCHCFHLEIWILNLQWL